MRKKLPQLRDANLDNAGRRMKWNIRKERERECERERETCRWNIKYWMHASCDHADITDYVMAHLSWNHDSTLVFELHESWPSSEIWIPRSVHNEASRGIVRFLSRHFDLGQIFGANSWRWFYNSRRVGYARFKRILLVPNWFRAFLLELPKRYVEIFSSRRIEKTDINRLWNAWIRRRRKQLFDPRWSRYTTSLFFANSSVRGWRRVGAQERNSATPGSFG